MERHHALVDTGPSPCAPRGKPLEEDGQQGEPQHALGIDLLGRHQALDALVEHYRRTAEQDESIDKGPKQREALITEREVPRGLMPGNALEYPCQGDGEGAAKVVDGVGDDGHAVGEPPADEGYDRKGQIDEKGREDIATGSLTMKMYMLMCHAILFS